MVETIEEDANGELTCTAVSRPSAAEEISYSIETRSNNIVSYNASPGSIAAPLIFAPANDLVTSASGLEIWIAIQGQIESWGGCDGTIGAPFMGTH